MELPFSQASESNKVAILDVIRHLFLENQTVLEIGSGTGQHGVFFAENLPGVIWQCADQVAYHDTISQRINAAGLPNLRHPIALEAISFDWTSIKVDAVFTANTAHIMSWSAVVAMFKGVSQCLLEGSFVQYGPFNRDGKFTSPSNQQFHDSLVKSDPAMGIRDDARLIEVAREFGMTLIDDIAMPANNRILVWSKKTGN